MQNKDAYTLQELFDFLPITLVQLAKDIGINEVTLARMRDGERTRRDTVNKLLLALSKIYERDLNIRNVTGMNVTVSIMQNKDAYTLQELFDFLPITLVQLAKDSGINEVTLARMRDGKCTRRDTVNKLLLALSKIYERDLNIRNVTGMNVMVNKRLEKKRKADQLGEDAA